MRSDYATLMGIEVGASMLDAFWSWLGALPPANASFIGTLTGSFLGLVAILLGALFNAHLNRNRDARLREAERFALASTLYAELRGAHRSLVENAEHITDLDPESSFAVPQPTMATVPDLLPKLGLLRTDTIRKVLDAYILTQHYLDDLMIVGGTLRQNRPEGRQMVDLAAKHAKTVASINKSRAAVVKDAMQALAPYLR